MTASASTANKGKKVLQMSTVWRLKYLRTVYIHLRQVGSVSCVRRTYSICLSVHQSVAQNKTSTLTKFFPFKSHVPAFLFFSFLFSKDAICVSVTMCNIYSLMKMPLSSDLSY